MGFRRQPTLPPSIPSHHNHSPALDPRRIRRTFPHRHHAPHLGFRRRRLPPLPHFLSSPHGLPALPRQMVRHARSLHLRQPKRRRALPQPHSSSARIPRPTRSCSPQPPRKLSLGPGTSPPVVRRSRSLPRPPRRIHASPSRIRTAPRCLEFRQRRSRTWRPLFPAQHRHLHHAISSPPPSLPSSRPRRRPRGRPPPPPLQLFRDPSSREIVDQKLLSSFPDFFARFETFLRHHGHREVEFDA